MTTFVGLFLTSMVLAGMDIGGITNLFMATLIVWLGAVIAGLILSKFLFAKYLHKPKV